LAALRALRKLGRAALPAVPQLIRRRFDGDRRCRTLAALVLAHLAPACSEPMAGLLRRLARLSVRPGELVRDLQRQPGWPATMHDEFRSACERRRCWHIRHRHSSEEAAGLECDAEHAWQLALWWRLSRTAVDRKAPVV
jgi:hypothetical protein